ncbi:SRPBCC family protein [Alkalihalobacillus pseudalcaliphilus]|uniref:SRPBCC family protein n=1 Tax=Alkalihalobacillus pseudalcaliphilus TaxID=79884 RepID=UPI00064DABF8|nr:SRPBCC family protein [Alkalihalobacillus pseudalcaliphilus]KMK76798.1 polyketide cyclase / dehydrase and lipid transport [Alkalihalobacillus pseudalcaliphilus]
MSIRFEVRRTAQVAKRDIYKGLLDLDLAKDWMQGLVRIQRLDEGAMIVGSQWEETRKIFGKEATEHFEVVQLNEPSKIMLRCDGTKGTTGKGLFIFTYTLRSFDDPTYTGIVLEGEINGLTGLARFFGKMLAGNFKKACAKDLDKLIDYLEK